MSGPCDVAPDYIRSISPYQPGKPIAELERELGLQNIIKLASNENPLGASPKAIEAVTRSLQDVARYPDGNGFELKAALAAKFDVTMDAIVLGNGSNDVLELAARAYLSPGASAVYSQYSFAVYPLATRAVGATGIEVPATRDMGHDLEAMRRAIREDTRVVFIANPNNPTGTYLSACALMEFLEQVPAHVLVVLDEAYTEYLAAEFRMDAVRWVRDFPNLLVTRTFSKAYGLAGLRVGFGIGSPAVVDLMNRVRQPFNVTAPAQAAATAALADEAFLAESYQLNQAGLRQISQGLDRLGCKYIPSFGNFILLEVGDGAAIYNKLLRLGVIARPVGNYGLPAWLRVSIGLEAENAAFLEALGKALKT